MHERKYGSKIIILNDNSVAIIRDVRRGENSKLPTPCSSREKTSRENRIENVLKKKTKRGKNRGGGRAWSDFFCSQRGNLNCEKPRRFDVARRPGKSENYCARIENRWR